MTVTKIVIVLLILCVCVFGFLVGSLIDFRFDKDKSEPDAPPEQANGGNEPSTQRVNT